MADDLQELGGISEFPLTPNWVTPVKASYALARRLIGSAGTRQELQSVSEWTPTLLEAMFLVDNKTDEYALLDFFYDRHGQAERFWVEHPGTSFTLLNTAPLGSLELQVERNRADLSWKGNERIYIYTTTGDKITRKVPTMDDHDGDRLDLNLETATDRELTTDDIQLIGKLMLARFNNDTIVLDYETTNVAQFRLRFYELVEEYDDV